MTVHSLLNIYNNNFNNKGRLLNLNIGIQLLEGKVSKKFPSDIISIYGYHLNQAKDNDNNIGLSETAVYKIDKAALPEINQASNSVLGTANTLALVYKSKNNTLQILATKNASDQSIDISSDSDSEKGNVLEISFVEPQSDVVSILSIHTTRKEDLKKEIDRILKIERNHLDNSSQLKIARECITTVKKDIEAKIGSLNNTILNVKLQRELKELTTELNKWQHIEKSAEKKVLPIKVFGALGLQKKILLEEMNKLSNLEKGVRNQLYRNIKKKNDAYNLYLALEQNNRSKFTIYMIDCVSNNHKGVAKIQNLEHINKLKSDIPALCNEYEQLILRCKGLSV